MAKGDRTRAILERIVGTKSKTYLADEFKKAFAEKYGIKKEELKRNISLCSTHADICESARHRKLVLRGGC